MPLGKKLGLLTGYVKPQEGTSKRTAAGSAELQRQWYDVITKLFAKVRVDALKVLQDEKLVELMMPILVNNLDEECLHAMGKNSAIVGSKDKKKHDNQNASSRSALIFFSYDLVCNLYPMGEANTCHTLRVQIPSRRLRILATICEELSLCLHAQGEHNSNPLWISS